MEDQEKSWRQVRLPADLCAAVEEKIKGTKFATIEELLSFVLEEIAAKKSGELEEQERKLIEQRLRDLGYI
jgi:uncharacterized membrane protein YebE (DUF533 family)